MKRFAIILNPTAGRGRGRLARDVIERTFTEAGVTYDLKETTGHGHALELAREACRDGYGVIVAAGGDGTAHEVINGMIQAAQMTGRWAEGGPIKTFGLIPVGTGNDLGWRLGIPQLDPVAAGRILLGDRRRVIDLGEMRDETGHTVFFGHHLGGGIEAAVNIESRKLHHLRGQLLYLMAVLRVIPRYTDAPALTVTHDGGTETRSALLVAVSNSGRSGGGFRISPDARLDDGLLDLVLISSPNIPRTFWLLAHLLKGTHIAQRRYVSLYQTKQVVIEAPAGLPVHLDGEIYRDDVRRVEAQIHPGRLEVIALP